MKKVLSVALLAALGLATVQAEEVFNSTNEFSTVQGQDNWHFGFYDGDVSNPYTPADFEEFPKTNGNSWIIHRGDRSGYWTSLYAVGGHPNGPVANYYQGTEHWTVRRWISDISGTILIEGFIRKSNGSYGDGTTAHIFLNETEIFSERRPGNDPNGVNYAIEVTVEVGDVLDFAISPNSYDMYDSTVFTAIGSLPYELEEPVIAFHQELNGEGCFEAASSDGATIMAYVQNASENTNIVYLWSTSEGTIGIDAEFSFHVGLNSNSVVYLTAEDLSTGKTKSSYELVRVSDTTPPVVTIEKRSDGNYNLKKPIDLDITVFDSIDGDISDFTVCMGKTSTQILDEFTGAVGVEVQNPLVAAQWKTTDVTVIASDASGNTTIETKQVSHKSQAQKKPEPKMKNPHKNDRSKFSRYRWLWWKK